MCTKVRLVVAPARRATTDPLQTVLFSYQSVSQSVSYWTGSASEVRNTEQACANWTIGANTSTNRTTGTVEPGQDDKSAGEES